MEKPQRAASGIERTIKDGIPLFDGTPELLPYYREEAIQYMFTFETHKRYLAGPRLAKELSGVARTIVRKKNLQNPQWLANPRGVYALLDYLEQAMERPSLVQTSQLVSRFFFQMKRRRQETMTQWVNRHSEALWEASRALKRVQQEYQPRGADRLRRSRPGASTGPEPEEETEVASRSQKSQEIYDENGLLRTDDDDDVEPSEGVWNDTSWNGRDWWQGWLQSWRGGWQSTDWHQSEYEPPETWHMEEEDFLPDFLVGFLLLHRSGLDANERANILAAIRGEFSVAAVSKALREQWTDEDLQRRDRRRDHAMVADFTEDFDEEDAAWADGGIEAPDPQDEPEAYAAFQDEQDTIDEALEAIKQHRKTLKDARWRQHQVRMNRKFYPMKGKSGDSGKGRGSSTFSGGKGKDGYNRKCLRCGGAHSTGSCPQKSGSAQQAEETAEIAFCAAETVNHTAPKDNLEYAANNNVLEVQSAFIGDILREDMDTEASFMQGQEKKREEDNLSADSALTCHQDIIAAGLGIVDCGATASLASIDALEAIMTLNRRQCGDDRVTVQPDIKPTFKFGNGERKECISSVQLQMDLDGHHGKMQLHVHDTPLQPALISVKALKHLGAVLDFSTNECVFTRVNPSAVIKLDSADNGHILMPLVSNLFQKARLRKTPFSGLLAE